MFNAKVIPGSVAEATLRETVYNTRKLFLFVIINLTQLSSSQIAVKYKNRGQNHEKYFLFWVFWFWQIMVTQCLDQVHKEIFIEGLGMMVVYWMQRSQVC